MIIVVINPISAFAESEIPDWIKQVAEFWITDQIDDEDFVQVIEYLVQQEIIAIPYAESPEDESSASIPSWIKTKSEFWVEGEISDDEFAIGLEWLINNGIIQVSMETDTIESSTSDDTSGISEIGRAHV